MPQARSTVCNNHGPLTRFVKLRVARAPGIPGTFSPPPTSKETTSYWSRYVPRRCVTHVPWFMSGSLTRDGGENVPGACTTRNFTYLSRGPSSDKFLPIGHRYIWYHIIGTLYHFKPNRVLVIELICHFFSSHISKCVELPFLKMERFTNDMFNSLNSS